MGQFFGILTDFFIPGVARFIGILAGILVLLSLKSRSTEVQSFFVGSSTALGIMGAGMLYFPAAIINVLIGFKLNKKVKEENTNEQL
ncbi:permease [Bacillus subtilis]|nr:permease [Bacillus subtilis]MDM5302060.1 permease [Bacillus subtilis]MDM5324113.1 permease [Bacillus subtilis]